MGSDLNVLAVPNLSIAYRNACQPAYIMHGIRAERAERAEQRENFETEVKVTTWIFHG